MERIKLLQRKIFPFIIAIILFLIPFFWFKPGEMDLGGDSGRLYFYDPVSYFFTSTLYTVSSSSVGGPTLNYVNIPFISLLIVLKYIFTSPTILIAGFYGISLSAGFIFCYLTIMELTESKNNFYAAIIGGLVYVFFPAFIDTWRHVLLTFNQVFLNPLIFYLLLKYFKTSRISILFVIVIITFIFSTNFSFFAAPGLFAFYPLSILFLVLYTKIILKRTIILKHILLSLFLFLGMQAFHLMNLIGSIFSFGNNVNTTIFSDAGKYDRGLSYFSSVAPSIKASINLLALPQNSSLEFFSNMFIVFPFILIIGLLYNKRNSFASSNRQKTILLTTFIFLIVLFFTTANITNIWLSIYKWLFNIPGFSIFRNFFGQWIYAYMFFYSILFGQAFYIVLHMLHYSKSRLKKLLTFLLIGVPILILVINGIPLIKGDIIRQTIWQSNNIAEVFRIDPDYEQALSFVRSLPSEGRVLTFPLTDYGYQVIAGRNGGAYLGPSAISYLAGKKDFSGFNELLGYQNVILNLIKSGKIETFKRILGLINVKYAFYDADPIVYDQFPSFPYQHGRGLPQDQHKYKEFIDSLNLHEIKNINNKFFVYEIPNDYYLPQVSIAKKSFTFNGPIEEIQTPLSLITNDNRIAINSYKENNSNEISVSEIKFDEILTDLRGQSPFLNVINSTNISSYDFPHASWGMNSLIYPIILWRENQQLAGYTKLDQIHIDRRIFLAEKRLAELLRWSKETSIPGSVKSIKEFNASWKEPNLWNAIFLQKYNYWEVSLLHYSRAMNELIDKINKASEIDNSFEANKDRIRRAIDSDKDLLYRIIQVDGKLTMGQKIYMAKLSTDMFDSLTERLQFTAPSMEKITYNLGKLEAGNYSIAIDKNFMLDTDQSKVKVDLNDNMISINSLEQDTNWFKLQNLKLKENDKNSFTLLLPEPANLFSNTTWESVEKGNFGTNSSSLAISDITKEKNGMFRKIENWDEKSYYMLTFDYITYGKFFKLFLFDKTEGKNQKTTNLVESILRSNNWIKYTASIASSDEAMSAYIQIQKITNNDLFNAVEKDQEQGTKLDIRNLSIVKVPNPKIILRKTNTINSGQKLPTITFTRINPTKYKIQVRNVFAPYTLVLVNKFDKNWRLTDPTRETDNVRAFFSRSAAVVAKTVIGIFEKENVRNDNPVLSHFNGNIKEIVSKDIFINKETFDTWGKEEIARYRHFSVNGFANAWYIELSDMGNKTDYDLIIEMSDQKLLYAGLLISISTVVFTLILLAKFLKK